MMYKNNKLYGVKLGKHYGNNVLLNPEYFNHDMYDKTKYGCDESCGINYDIDPEDSELDMDVDEYYANIKNDISSKFNVAIPENNEDVMEDVEDVEDVVVEDDVVEVKIDIVEDDKVDDNNECNDNCDDNRDDIKDLKNKIEKLEDKIDCDDNNDDIKDLRNRMEKLEDKIECNEKCIRDLRKCLRNCFKDLCDDLD